MFVAAAPGYWAIYLTNEGDIIRSPVLAWALVEQGFTHESYYAASPICWPGLKPGSYRKHGLTLPDGRAVFSDLIFTSEAELVDFLRDTFK